MKKPLIPALLLIVGSVALGATVFRAPLATAAGGIPSMLVANDKQHALPVEEQNLDAEGNIKVHEQGTADVNVTNSSLPVAPLEPITGGGGSFSITCPDQVFPGTITASAVQIGWTSLAGHSVRLSRGQSVVADFAGPQFTGERSLALSLTRPVAFDQVGCFGTGDVVLNWVGNEP
jgi:hypothetical protein